MLKSPAPSDLGIEERNTLVSVFQNLTLPMDLRTKTLAAKAPELLCKDGTN